MKLSTTWRDQFCSGDLARGMEYYFDGHVHGLHAVDTGWEAVVEGTDSYEVYVPAGEGSLDNLSCDCPRFANGCFCKHLAAVCLAIEDEPEIPQEGSGQTPAELIDNLAAEDLRTFLKDAVQADAALGQRLLQRYGSIDLARAKRQLADQIDQAVWTCSSHGFIDWHGALQFERSWHAAVDDALTPLIARGALTEALELSLHALDLLQDIDIDDSDGFTSSAIDEIGGYWKALLKKGGAAFAPTMFDRIRTFYEEPARGDGDCADDIFGYEREMAEDFLTKDLALVPECHERVLAMAQERLDQTNEWQADAQRKLDEIRRRMGRPDAPVSNDDRTLTARQLPLNQEAHRCTLTLNSASYTRHKWTLVKLRCLESIGTSTVELLAAAGTHITDEKICQLFVDRALQEGKTERAIELLRACKEAERKRKNGEYPLHVSEQLAELLSAHDVPAMRDELLYLLQHVGNYGAKLDTKELWGRLCASHATDDWPEQRKAYLAALADKPVWVDCLALEGMFDTIMDEAERKAAEGAGSTYLVSRYEAELVERCPKRVLDLYLNDLTRNRRYPGRNRKTYHEFAQRLSHIKGLPGGEQPVAKIISAMRAGYPQRPALLDELSRV